MVGRFFVARPIGQLTTRVNWPLMRCLRREPSRAGLFATAAAAAAVAEAVSTIAVIAVATVVEVLAAAAAVM